MASDSLDTHPRSVALSLMASLALASGSIRAAEGYLLELLAWKAFGDSKDEASDHAGS